MGGVSKNCIIGKILGIINIEPYNIHVIHCYPPFHCNAQNNNIVYKTIYLARSLDRRELAKLIVIRTVVTHHHCRNYT